MKVLVTGGTGLVGSALNEVRDKSDEVEWIFLSSQDCDLRDANAVDALFEKEKPDVVIHLAAHVGGLFKNLREKATMYENNILINTNVLRCCSKYDVQKTVSCLSTCIFPDKVGIYPINELCLHCGPPHQSNEGYAYAKRMLDVQSRMYRNQFDQKFVTVIPTNIYGKHDNFNLEDAHVVPALIHKCYLASKSGENVIVKGTGKPLRQFIYANDLAKLIIWVIDNYDDSEPIILSPDESGEISIKEVAETIADRFGIKDKIQYLMTCSDGQFKKTADNSKLKRLFWKTSGELKFVNFKDGIDETVNWFIENYQNART